MISEEDLTTLWHKVHAEGSSNHRGDVRKLIDEVRRQQTELVEARCARYRIATDIFDERTRARKAAAAWKALAKRLYKELDDATYAAADWSAACLESYDDNSRQRDAFDALRKQCRAWKAKAMEYRNAAGSENRELSDEAEALRRVMEKQQQEHLAEAQDSIEECELLRVSLAKMQVAINRYCETRNNVVDDCGPYSDAIGELYRLSGESGFRPRVRAGTEVER